MDNVKIDMNTINAMLVAGERMQAEQSKKLLIAGLEAMAATLRTYNDILRKHGIPRRLRKALVLEFQSNILNSNGH